MTKKPTAGCDSRRGFLQRVAMLGGVAGAAIASPGTVIKDDAEDQDRPASSAPKGYRVTPHIAEYYKKARF